MNRFEKLPEILAKHDIRGVHPVCLLMPAMNDDDWTVFTASIADWTDGDDPIVVTLTPDRQLLDGRHSLLAASINSKPVEFRTHAGDPWRYVIKEHIPRRHFNAGQLAMIGLSMLDQVEGDERRAALLPDDRKILLGQEEGEERRAALGKTSSTIAALVGVGGRTIEKAKAVRSASQALADMVLSGDIVLEEAYQRTRKAKAISESQSPVVDPGAPAVAPPSAPSVPGANSYPSPVRSVAPAPTQVPAPDHQPVELAPVLTPQVSAQPTAQPVETLSPAPIADQPTGLAAQRAKLCETPVKERDAEWHRQYLRAATDKLFDGIVDSVDAAAKANDIESLERMTGEIRHGYQVDLRSLATAFDGAIETLGIGQRYIHLTDWFDAENHAHLTGFDLGKRHVLKAWIIAGKIAIVHELRLVLLQSDWKYAKGNEGDQFRQWIDLLLAFQEFDDRDDESEAA